MSTPHHPPSTCFQSCPLLTTHRLPVSSHVHSSPPTVYLFPVMSTPHHPPSTCFQSCPLLTHPTCLVMSTPHHPPLPPSHVHSSPPTVYLFHMSTPHHPPSSMFPVMSTPHHPPSTCFQSCPLLTTHRLPVSSHVHSSPPTVYLFPVCSTTHRPVMSTPHHPLSSCSTSSHVHSHSPPTV